MSAIRQDAWTEEDDLILAEVTLRHIREGSTQLSAFDEVGEKIGRTSAACGFRWNSFVRKKYEMAIQLAKTQRQKRSQMKRQVTVKASHISAGDIGSEMFHEHEQVEPISVDSIIRFLRQWKHGYQEMGRMLRIVERDLEDTRSELDKIKRENHILSKQVNEVETDNRVVNEDYKALIQIMDRARKLAFLADKEEDHKSRFKMDANGNLERIDS